jgi:hypothetical protein
MDQIAKELLKIAKGLTAYSSYEGLMWEWQGKLILSYQTKADSNLDGAHSSGKEMKEELNDDVYQMSEGRAKYRMGNVGIAAKGNQAYLNVSAIIDDDEVAAELRENARRWGFKKGKPHG